MRARRVAQPLAPELDPPRPRVQRQMRIPMQNSILSIIDEKFSEFDTDGDGALDETETRSLAAEVLHMNQAD